MGFFTKKEHTHVVRDEHGNVIRLERNLDEQGMKSVEQLEHEYKETHPTRWQKMKTEMNERQLDRKMQRGAERRAYNESYNKARIQRYSHIGAKEGYQTSGERLERFIMGSPKKRQSQPRRRYTAPPRYNPPSKSRSHPHKKKRKSINDQFRPMKLDIFDNWGFFK